MIKRRPWRWKRTNRICPICGSFFVVPKCHSFQKTCSKACSYKYRRQFTESPKYGKRVQKICLNCKQKYEVLKNSKKNLKFCSRSCYLEYKSKNVKYPDKQRFQGARWIKIRRNILKRDNNHCFLCEQQGSEVHHEVPYSISGNDAENNLILLCKSCHLHIGRIIEKAKELNYKPIPPDEEGLVLLLENG